MGAHLIYRPREGVVFGTVAGRSIRLATLRNQAVMDIAAWRQSSGTGADRITDWTKVQELRTGRATSGAPAERLKVAEHATLEIYDFPGRYAQRFDGVDKGGTAGGRSGHGQHARVIWVKTRIKSGFPSGGVCLHGPPPCGNPRCIVIAQGWDSLFQALKTVGQLSLFVEL
jgi:hypothetical protein